MKQHHRYLCAALAVAAILIAAPVFADETDPREIPAVKDFIGTGFGSSHEKAPAELSQFGRLVGVWTTKAEMRKQDGGWIESAPGTWIWKYAIGGFAVTDMFHHSVDHLPMYMANLGRDYMLTANRIYDVTAKKWQVAWMANGAGQAMGADFGTFTATLENDAIVMTSPPGDGAFGLQRVVFHDIGEDSFKWKSEYSQDGGETWTTVMRIRAKRVASP